MVGARGTTLAGHPALNRPSSEHRSDVVGQRDRVGRGVVEAPVAQDAHPLGADDRPVVLREQQDRSGDCATAEGTPFQLVTSPMQFGGEPHAPKRAPEFNEHGDEILESLGLDWDTIVDLKVRGVVA